MKNYKIDKKFEKYKEQNGITLIALVITILVLLILAGVSIAMLTGDNGLLSKANNAKELYAKATFYEKIQIVVNAYLVKNNFWLEDKELDEIISELNSYGDIETKKVRTYDGKTDIEIKDSNGNICLVTNTGKIVEKVEGKVEDWEIDRYTNNSYIIKKYIGEDLENIIIPNYIDGNWIQSLSGNHSENSIMDGYNVKNITISEGIKKLDTSTFLQIKSIETVKLPNTIEILDWGAFHGCSNLKEINFPKSLKSIGQVTFDGCKSLPSKIALGENIEEIGTYAFANSSVKNIKINRKKGTVKIGPRTIL